MRYQLDVEFVHVHNVMSLLQCSHNGEMKQLSVSVCIFETNTSASLLLSDSSYTLLNVLGIPTFVP